MPKAGKHMNNSQFQIPKNPASRIEYQVPNSQFLIPNAFVIILIMMNMLVLGILSLIWHCDFYILEKISHPHPARAVFSSK